MKLHKNQLALIRHLILLNIMAYADCLTFLDTENTGPGSPCPMPSDR